MLVQHANYFVQLKVLKVIDRRATLLSVVDFAFLLAVNYITIVLSVEYNPTARNLTGWLFIALLFSRLLMIVGTHSLRYLIDLFRRCRKCYRHREDA